MTINNNKQLNCFISVLISGLHCIFTQFIFVEDTVEPKLCWDLIKLSNGAKNILVSVTKHQTYNVRVCDLLALVLIMSATGRVHKESDKGGV